MEQGSRGELGPAGDKLVLEPVTGGNQGGQRKSFDEEAKKKTSSQAVEELGLRLVQDCVLCEIKGVD